MNKDVLIIGSGMVGMSIAYRLITKNPELSILILEKEKYIGMHSSGRNSGVLHAGIYYEPNSLKAKVCIKGAKLLKSWCEDQNLKVLKCGKVIVPQKRELDNQIDLLKERGKKNGAIVEIIGEKEIKELVPFGYSSSGRALWSPNTAVVDPKSILERLKEILLSKKVEFIFDSRIQNVDKNKNKISITAQAEGNNKNTFDISYGYLFNTAGLYADKVAKIFEVGLNYEIFPFKGSYWKLDSKAPINFNTNLYPVPDLNMPFLGVHVTPTITGEVYLGPTAIPSLGRENYNGLENLEPINSLKFLNTLIDQFAKNEGGFRKYAFDQAFHGLKPFFFRSAKLLIPNLKIEYLKPCKKVGIRPQLYDKANNKIIKDFLIQNEENSIHVLNAISPAFTASFAFADIVIQKTNSFP